MRPRRGEGGDQGGGGVVAVSQQQHPGSQAAGQISGVVQVAGADRVEHGVDHRPGSAGQQGTQS